MKVVKGYPPNIDEIRRHFDISGRDVVFTWGNKLYDPSGGYISPDLMVHEEVHARQQIFGKRRWWKRYLKDQQFRLDQEVEAYRAQYQYALNHYNKRVAKKLLNHIANALSSEVYGNIVNYKQAIELIR